MAAKYLFVGAEVGLFESLAGRPATLDELAQRMEIPRRTIRIIADAAVALNFLQRTGDQYRNSMAAAGFLSGGGPDLRMYGFAADRVLHLLRRVREQVPAQAWILLMDLWTDSAHRQPVFAALMAGEFLLTPGGGDVYSVDERSHWR